MRNEKACRARILILALAATLALAGCTPVAEPAAGSGGEAASAVLSLQSAPEEESDTSEKRQLTLDDVAALAEKGDELEWSDFSPYAYYESGCGYYIRTYPIDEMFSVSIAGVDPLDRGSHLFLSEGARRQQTVDRHPGWRRGSICQGTREQPCGQDWRLRGVSPHGGRKRRSRTWRRPGLRHVFSDQDDAQPSVLRISGCVSSPARGFVLVGNADGRKIDQTPVPLVIAPV